MFYSKALPVWSRRACMRLAVGFAAHFLQAEELRRIDAPNEEALDPGLVNLLKRLRGIVAERKHVALAALMSAGFRVEFDAGKGPVAFRRQWHPESASNPIWGILDRLLAMPGHCYMDNLYAVPYVFARFPFDLDPLRHVVAVKDSVDLLAQPKTDAMRVGSINRSIVPLAEPFEPPVIIPAGGFVELKHPNVGRCFAASADIYSPAAHRAFFEKRQGQWRWISLAAATTKDPPELHLHKTATV